MLHHTAQIRTFSSLRMGSDFLLLGKNRVWTHTDLLVDIAAGREYTGSSPMKGGVSV